MAKYRTKRKRQRKFVGNQHTRHRPTVQVMDASVSASARKLGTMEQDCDIPLQASPLEGNRIVDMEILCSVFSSLACPECKSTSLNLNERTRCGVSFMYGVM